MRFQTISYGDVDYHLRSLRDVQQCPESVADVERFGLSSATWPLFGVLWRSEELLSHLMHSEDFGRKRILEIGCGLALASLVLKRRGADITATDQNPSAGAFLQFNTNLNALGGIEFGRASWQDEESSLGRFDLLVGSDLLYDAHNLEPLIRFIDRHLKSNAEIIVVDPGRGMTAKFSRLIQELGFSVETLRKDFSSTDDVTAKYWIMRFARCA